MFVQPALAEISAGMAGPLLKKTLLALLTFAVGFLVARFVRSAIRRLLKREAPEKTAVLFASNAAYAIVLAVAVATALAEIGVQTASIIAIFGATGIAIGLALQNSLANLASGLLLVVLKPFKVGDYVECASVAGSVVEIGLFMTVLNTFDNRRVAVPNAKITEGTIVNYSAMPTRRADISVSVSYGTNLSFAQETLEKLLAEDPRVLADPPPRFNFADLGDNGIEIKILAWLKKEDFWPYSFEIRKRVKDRFDEVGITIPFPQRDIHIRKD